MTAADTTQQSSPTGARHRQPDPREPHLTKLIGVARQQRAVAIGMFVMASLVVLGGLVDTVMDQTSWRGLGITVFGAFAAMIAALLWRAIGHQIATTNSLTEWAVELERRQQLLAPPPLLVPGEPVQLGAWVAGVGPQRMAGVYETAAGTGTLAVDPATHCHALREPPTSADVLDGRAAWCLNLPTHQESMASANGSTLPVPMCDGPHRFATTGK
jgi:hypothetical protein